MSKNNETDYKLKISREIYNLQCKDNVLKATSGDVVLDVLQGKKEPLLKIKEITEQQLQKLNQQIITHHKTKQRITDEHYAETVIRT